MEEPVFKKMNSPIKLWYLPMIVGIVFIGIGIWVFTAPRETYIFLSIIFGISFLVNGLIETVFAISNRKEYSSWGWSLIMGIINIIVGLLLFNNPEITAAALALYIGFILLFRSVAAIILSRDLKTYGVGNWGFMMTIGILGLLLSFILLWNPILAGYSLVFWLSGALIFAGLFAIYFSIKLKKLHDTTTIYME